MANARTTNMEPPLAVSIRDATKIVGIGRSLIYMEISAGRLKLTKVGRRSFLRVSDLTAWLEARANGDPGEVPASPIREGAP